MTQHDPSMDNRDILNAFAYINVGERNSPAFSATPSSPHYEIFANFAPNTFSAMKYRNLGKNGIRLPNIGFCAWNAFGTRITEQTAEELLTVAYENGINYFDTGDGFGNGKSELVLGSILKKKPWKRSSYIVSTKLFWYNGPSAHNGGGLSRKFIIEAVEASLKRLQLRYIDVVLINKLDGMCPVEEIVKTMSNLINNGSILYWGTSRWSPMHIAEAYSVARQFNCPPPICEQLEYHMFTREKMELFMPELFHKIGTGCIVWSPFSLNNDEGIQLITRRSALYEDKVFRNPKTQDLVSIGSKLGCDQTQLIIAWCLRNENVNSVLIAPTSVDQLYQFLHTLKIVPKLTTTIIEDIEKALDNKPQNRRNQNKEKDQTSMIIEEANESNI